MLNVQQHSSATIYDLQFEDLSVLEQPQRFTLNSTPLFVNYLSINSNFSNFYAFLLTGNMNINFVRELKKTTDAIIRGL